MTRKIAALAGLCLMLAAVAGPGRAEEKLIEPGKLFQFLGAYLDLPPTARDRFHMVYIIIAKTGALSDLRLALVDGARRTPLPIAGDGRVTRLPTAGELTRAKLAIAAPAGAKLGLRLELAATLPAATEYGAEALQASIAQGRAGIRKGAGVFAVAAPKIDRALFRGAESGELILADGRRLILPKAKGDPFYLPVANQAARTIRLKRAPSAVILSGKD